LSHYFVCCLIVICLVLTFLEEMRKGEGCIMSMTKLRNSTTINKPLGITAVLAAVETDLKDNDGDQAQANRSAAGTSPRVELTADSVCMYLQRTSAMSCQEIDALISELRRLQQKLDADGNRLEEGIMGFAAFNQSVVKLTELASDGFAHVKPPSLSE
jgi:hypothetical protein